MRGTPAKGVAEPDSQTSGEGGDRAFTDLGMSTSRTRVAAALGGALVLVALVAGIHAAPSSGEDQRTDAANAAVQRVEKPPPMDGLPEEEAAAQDSPGAVGDAALAAELAAQLQQRALREAEERRRQAQERRRSKIVLFDAVVPADEEAAEPARGLAMLPQERRRSQGAREPGASDSREERFAREAALETTESMRAERIAHPSTTVPQGTLIAGVLETAIQSDLPGMIRAVVSRPVFAFDGTAVIPRGSTLIGKYQSGLVRGQTRLFVLWTRLLRPDGVSMEIGSPGADSLGRAGLAGEVETHFLEIFGSSVLLSLLDGGAQVAAARAQRNDGGVIVQSGGQDLSRAAEIALQNRIQIPPTIQVPRGTQVEVFVAKDLDFAQATRPE